MRREPLTIDLSAADEIAHHGLGALLREVHVIGAASGRVRMALNLDMRDLGVRVDHVRELIEELERATLDNMAVSPEIDRIMDLDLALTELNELALRATHELGRAGLVGAVIESIDHAVAIAIREGATLIERGARLIRALIFGIGDAVAVVIEVRAAILILKAVHIFGLIRTLILLVGNAVAVIIRIRAAVFILKAVEIFGFVGALIVNIGDAVAVAIAGADAKDLRPMRDRLHAMAKGDVDASRREEPKRDAREEHIRLRRDID